MIRATMAIVFAAILAGMPSRAIAQGDDEAAVMEVVGALFDAMRAGDSAAMRATLHSSATAATAFVRDGVPTLARETSLDGFVQAVGTPHDEVWDERVWDPEVKVDGLLATAWMNYAFFAGDTFSHCGVNAFQLFKGADGWKIFHVADTRRREGCEMPEE
jgi:hypothetical protein